MSVEIRTLEDLANLAGRRFVVVDLEATCWRADRSRTTEIIEIGAVAYDLANGSASDFQSFVRPILSPELSEFCRSLTKITQAEVDGAPTFPVALERMLDWAGEHEPYVLASWGAYDKNQFRRDCELHQLTYPFGRHLNIKKAFARVHHTKPCGMAKALQRLGLQLIGTHHRGIDDARNIARIFDSMMRSAQED